ncbi:hypothetical protein ACTXT7_004882 [Hymenolepis weldensis]
MEINFSRILKEQIGTQVPEISSLFKKEAYITFLPVKNIEKSLDEGLNCGPWMHALRNCAERVERSFVSADFNVRTRLPNEKE